MNISTGYSKLWRSINLTNVSEIVHHFIISNDRMFKTKITLFWKTYKKVINLNDIDFLAVYVCY